MNQSAGTNGPDDERPAAPEDERPAHVPDSEVPTVALTPSNPPATEGSATEPPAEPAIEPAAQTAPEPVIEPAAHTAAEPAVEPAAQTAPEPAVQPVAEPAVQPAAKTVAEPAIELAAQTSPEPGVQPAAQTVAEPGIEPPAELAAEPAAETVAEPAVQPAEGVPAEPPPALHDLVQRAYGPLTQAYERLDARLREAPEDVPPVGWAPHLAALRALCERQVAGDWETLARLLVDPASLAPDDARVRLVHVPAEEDEPAAVRAVLGELLAASERALLLVPTEDRARELLAGLEDDPEIFSLLIETQPAEARAPEEADALEETVVDAPAPAETDLDETVLDEVPPVDTAPEPPAVRDFGANGTVEFRPITTPPSGLPQSEPPLLDPADVTRAEPLPVLPDDPNVTRAEPLPVLPAEGEQASEITRLEPLPALPEDIEELAESASAVTQANALPPLPEDAPADATTPDGIRPRPPADGEFATAPLPGDAAAAAVAPDGDTPVTTPPLPTAPPAQAAPAMPAAPAVPEERVRAATVRPVGEAWRQSWRTEARMLQRGLMWLEQWPRDEAELRSVQAENLRRGEELDAEHAALEAAIREAGETAVAAERAAAEAEAEAERLVAVEAEAERELAGPRAEAERLQAAADVVAAEARELTGTADAAHARCAELDARDATARSELDSARRLEESLTGELERAREALPAAEEEARRLAAADADASAEGHASYYRLVSAESALSAMRRKMTLGQRLHVASPPSGLSSMRAEVRARTRDADEAAKRAQEAKDAAERAEARRLELATFVSEGGTRLATARDAQERLGTELAWLATERETAAAEYREQARLAAESVDRATQAGLEARAARQAAQAVQERADAARQAREEALAFAGRARADAEAAANRAAELDAELDRHAAEAARERAARAAELETAAEAEARSRENVREICGADPADDPEPIPAHQLRAMARIEQLTGYLEDGGGDAGEALLRAADLVVGTPLGAGLTAAEEEFDALIVAGAGALPDAEFLIGAVRARRWVLVGAPGVRPPSRPDDAGALAPSGNDPVSADAAAPVDSALAAWLASGPFERCAAAAAGAGVPDGGSPRR